MSETTKARIDKISTVDRAGYSLQEKFVKLREAVPAIVQKKHSDGVKYKFAKIFDVYELLTPAMNEWGVNFTIVREVATRKHDNGDPMYYHSYVQLTRNGDRIVWVYEADLTVRWINADHPEDFEEVTLHAIGTNDGGPDKAKGSAWTYCLKYYFFEKFGIDQGEDDPDNADHGSDAPAGAGNWPNQPHNYSGRANTQPKPQGGQNGRTGAQATLSDAQLSRMYRKGADAGYTAEQVNDRILKKYGQQEPRNMTRAQYDETCAALDAAANNEGTGGTDSAE